jgi:hypothetical protein
LSLILSISSFRTDKSIKKYQGTKGAGRNPVMEYGMHLSNLACITYIDTDMLLASIIFTYLIPVEECMHKVKSEVFTVTTIENTVIWDMTSCSLVEIYSYFRGIYCFSFRVKELAEKTNSLVLAWL